jgi:alpha-tubulin suppressor-like RCC1 family protein
VYIMARDFHSQALCSDGSLWSWGSGTSGELGNGAFNNSAVPVQVSTY